MPQAEIDLVNDLVVDNIAENHCVPILSAFPDTNRPEVHYFVHDHPEVCIRNSILRNSVFCVGLHAPDN